MIRTNIMASVVVGFTAFAADAADEALELACSGFMIEPTAVSRSPRTVQLSIDPGEKVALSLGPNNMDARVVSDNQIQLKFETKDFIGEYFHYTGDLFFIYHSWHLARLHCTKGVG
jgi:hypothetical protein